MTPTQRELARHALGLGNEHARSYRNHFVAGRDHADHPDWMDMVRAREAVCWPNRKSFGGDDLFKLTACGARAALNDGESLDPEEFPGAARPASLTEAMPTSTCRASSMLSVGSP